MNTSNCKMAGLLLAACAFCACGASGFTCNYFKAAYEWARRRGDVTLLPVRGAVIFGAKTERK